MSRDLGLRDAMAVWERDVGFWFCTAAAIGSVMVSDSWGGGNGRDVVGSWALVLPTVVEVGR